MANYKGHLVGGTAMFFLMIPFLARYIHSLEAVLLPLVCTIIGALFPDIDIKSKGQQLFYVSLIPVYIFFCVQGNLLACILLSIGATIPLCVRHRGIFHSFWFIAISVAGLAYIFTLQWPACDGLIILNSFCFMCGVVSHLWLDFGFRFLLR